MEQQELKSKIAIFLNIYFDCISGIYNNIPLSYVHYKCFFNNEQKNIYEFIDHCCEHRPLNGTYIELTTGTVYFCDPALKWKLAPLEGCEPTDGMRNLAENLQKIVDQAAVIRAWEKRKP